MVSYKIFWKKLAKKELKRLDKKEISKILNEIEKLSNNPYTSNHKKILGTSYIYRIRIGNYRIIYAVENKQLIIEIVRVRHRKEVYKNL